MDGIRSEWPLIVFTVCAPVCAGAWIVAASLTLIEAFPQAHMLTMGWCGIALCGLLLGALACSTLHLGKPLKALRAFMRLGNSSVSNEVFMGALFAVSCVVYVASAQGLAATGALWKVLLALVAAFAGLFVLFQCLAYRMRTVWTWNSFAFSIEFAVIALLGGVCVVGALACSALTVPFDVRFFLVVVEAACCLALVAVVFAQGAVVAESVSAKRDAKVALKRWSAFAAVRVLAAAGGSALWACGMLAEEPMFPLIMIGTIMVIVGIVAGRCAFYRFYANVGLPRGSRVV